MEKTIGEVRKIFDQRTFKYEVLICFWLCIHLDRLELAQLLYDHDPIVEKILVNMRKSGKELVV